MSYYAVATTLISMVGEYLFDDRKQQDTASVLNIAKQVRDPFMASDSRSVQSILSYAAEESGGRYFLLDQGGKIQFDSRNELNGTRLEVSESVSVLLNGEKSAYGVHTIKSSKGWNLLQLFQPFDESADWKAYSAARILSDDGTLLGALVYSAPIQNMMQRMFELQHRMALYFIAAALLAFILAIFFSRVITKPIASLMRSIQHMGRGDFSSRVPEKGSGELRKLSETFNSMAEKLEMLDQSRNQFVSNASHELKTPLATMKILLESIIYQPDMDTQMRTEFLSDINKEIDRLTLIISDLLTLVSMDSKTMHLNRSSFSFSQLVSDCAERLRLVTADRKQEIKMQLDDRCEMYADMPKLTQVVYNLMENASKYTQDGGTISVRLVRSGHNAVFTVKDNGPGIPKEDQPHIFERFYRVDKARSRETGGTGLGLSIVHQMVLMHGGTVSVDSEEGQGTTFTVELPIHQG